DTNSFGDNSIPESNLRVSVREIISFTWVPPMSTTRILFFIATMQRAPLFAEPELLEEAALFRFRCRSRRGPAFDNLEREEAEQSEPREFEIEPEIFGDLRDGADAVELRSKLRFRHGEAKVLDALVTVARVSRDGARFDVRRLAQFLELNAAQGGARPMVDIFFARHVAAGFRQRLVSRGCSAGRFEHGRRAGGLRFRPRRCGHGRAPPGIARGAGG